MTHAAAIDIERATAELLRPPRRMRVSQAAESYVRLSLPGGYAGPWDPGLTPYMVEPMDMLSSRQYETVVFVGPARSGKTQGLIDAWIGYAVTCDPGDLMVVLPTQETARDYARRRINRLHRNSPEIGRKLSPRRNDDNTHDKHYRTGMILTLAWPTSSQLAGRDIRYIALTDYDSMPDDVDGEGEPYSLAKKRTQTFLSGGMSLVESNPKREILVATWKPETAHEAPPTAGGILPLYNRGDRRRWYWPCPHCGEYFQPTFQQLIWDDNKDQGRSADTVRMACPHCGGTVEQAERKRLNSVGVWLRDGERIDKRGRRSGTPRRSTIASYWMQGPAAAFQSWSSLVSQWLRAESDFKATGSEEALKTTVNVDQGCAYLPRRRQAERDPTVLEQRAEPILRTHVPDGVRYLTAAVDVQGSRFVVQIEGIGIDNERWVIDRYDLYQSDRDDGMGGKLQIDPAGYLEDWDLLLQVIESTYPLDDDTGRQMKVAIVACDSGGRAGVTDRAYNFWRRLRLRGLHSRLALVKGDSKTVRGQVRKTFPDSQQRSDRKASARGDVPVFLANTDSLKDAVTADLERSEPGPGYIHFPDWLPSEFYAELAAEVRTDRGWQRIAERNESLDLMVYNRVAGLVRGRVDWQNPPAWALPWDTNILVVDDRPKEEEKPVQIPRRPRNWVSSWKR